MLILTRKQIDDIINSYANKNNIDIEKYFLKGIANWYFWWLPNTYWWHSKPSDYTKEENKKLIIERINDYVREQNFENKYEYKGSYQGNRLHCGDCEHHKYTMEFKKIDENNTKTIYHSNCKMIDHNKVKLQEPYFKSYDCGQHSCDICCYFKPASWNISTQKEWKGIKEYIDFLDKDFYIGNEYQITHNVSNFDKIKRTLVYNNNEYVITLRSWLEGNAIKDNKINYVYWYEIHNNKRKNNRILHNEAGSIEIS